MTEIAVSVRDLVRFCFRSGDIDHRFTPSPSGPQGVEGHQRVYRSRPAGYRSEYALQYRRDFDGVALLLRGRADGYDPQGPVLEEIKTCRVAFDRIPQSVSDMHLAQDRLYAAMLCVEQPGLRQVTVRLTWFNIDSAEQHSVDQEWDRVALAQYLDEALAAFAHWLRRLAARRRARDGSIAALDFPLGRFRPGQREIAELVYKCADQGGQLLVEAPTGIGKTAAVLYPALKGMAADKHDAVIFSTARTVGRRAAEDTLELFREAGLDCSALSLSAKDSVCLSPGSACHPQDCPYAEAYYDRLPQAMEQAMDRPTLRQEELLELAQAHTVCPWHLAQDLLPWMDLVICDLHYLYSFTALLAGQMERDGRRWSALLDEAHNLPGRARDMYRAELAKADVLAAKKGAPKRVASALERLNRVLLALQKEDWLEQDFDSRETVPGALQDALQGFTAATGEVGAEDPLLLQRHPLVLECLFRVLQFQRVIQAWGDDYRFELHRGEGRQGLRLVLNCLDASRLLSGAQERLHSLTAFSATLSPLHWSRTGLGMGEAAVCSRQRSPFAAEQLQVFLATAVDTRYRARQQSLPQLASLLRQWLQQCDGNCIVYLPSYRYLQDALAEVEAAGGVGSRLLWQQRPEAGREAQGELLRQLRERRDVAAFCILGGLFGEGIDLRGEQLSSVVVVGVGLPQFNRDSERLRDWHQARGRDGFAHTYRYPGMQKVDQALGRVVRREDDRGAALLIDARYALREYRELLPPWWSYRDWQGD